MDSKTLLGSACAALLLCSCGTPSFREAAVEQGETFRCESISRDPTFCAAETRGGVVLISQDSRKACTKGRTWGERRGGIWVSEGCRGTFLATHGNRNPSRSFGMRGHPNIPANVTRSGGYVVDPGNYAVRCESIDGDYNFCPAATGAGVEIVDQYSDRRCTRGRTWGYNEDGVWVDDGCRAEFVVSTDFE